VGNQHANEGRLAHHFSEPPRQAAIEGDRIGKLNGVEAAWSTAGASRVGKSTLTGTLYRHVAEAAGAIDHDDPQIDAALARAGSGAALSAEVRAPLEAHLGYSLDRVRVHTDGAAAAAARALGAEAFTIGEDIYFADGKFAPSSQAGKQLLAHEVMHVVQAWEGRTRRGGGLHVSDPGESLEREAEAVATAMQSRTLNALAGSTAWSGGAGRTPGAMSAGGSSLVLRKPSGAKLKTKSKAKGKATATAQEAAPASPESAATTDPLIAGVIKAVDLASARIEAAAANPVPPAPAAPAIAPASVPSMTVEIDFKNIKVKVVKKSEAEQATQAPAAGQAPKAASASTSHGGTRTVEGDTTLDVALTRLQIPTTYRLGEAFPSAGERAAKEEIEAAKKLLVAAKQLVAEAKAKIDPPKAKGKAKQPAVTADEKAQAQQELPELEAKVAALEEDIRTKEATFKSDVNAHTLKQLEAQVSGDKDANEFWCSGLSLWTLAASGYDLDMQLRGVEDGQPFKFKPRKGGKPQVITLKALIDGEGPAVEAVVRIQRDNLTKGGAQIIELDEDAFLGGHRLGYGADGEAISDGVKGAAGAFAVFGLGVEIQKGAQKPGDFAQKREASAINVKGEIDATKKKLANKKLEEAEKQELEARLAVLEANHGQMAHQGKGHAWQVTEVRAAGQALFGAPGSPRLLAGKAPAAAAWLDSAVFAIDRTTRPELVGEHTVDAERLIEANIASSTKTENGTVRETDPLVAPKKNAKPAKERTVFYGRLNESPWAGWTPATEASAREFIAANEAAPAAPTAAPAGAATE
jgi:hypothetical protein